LAFLTQCSWQTAARFGLSVPALKADQTTARHPDDVFLTHTHSLSRPRYRRASRNATPRRDNPVSRAFRSGAASESNFLCAARGIGLGWLGTSRQHADNSPTKLS